MKIREKLAGRTLFINCATEQTRIALFLGKELIVDKIIESHSELSGKLLIEIDQLVKKNDFQVQSVAVFPGPGSYTGLRIGLTVANFFAWSLGIPIYQSDNQGFITSPRKKFIMPIYLKEAHITRSRPKD